MNFKFCGNAAKKTQRYVEKLENMSDKRLEKELDRNREKTDEDVDIKVGAISAAAAFAAVAVGYAVAPEGMKGLGIFLGGITAGGVTFVTQTMKDTELLYNYGVREKTNTKREEKRELIYREQHRRSYRK